MPLNDIYINAETLRDIIAWDRDIFEYRVEKYEPRCHSCYIRVSNKQLRQFCAYPESINPFIQTFCKKCFNRYQNDPSINLVDETKRRFKQTDWRTLEIVKRE